MATLVGLTGPLAAFGASVTWAYASARYARVSREVGSARVNLARAVTASAFFAALYALTGDHAAPTQLSAQAVAWLLASIVASYAFGDSLFFTAARRVGVTTALSIASVYPIWAALFGALVAHEPFGPGRALGTMLSVAGVVWLVRLTGSGERRGSNAGRDAGGLVLAFATSLLWAANSVAVKRGSQGLDLSLANALRFGMALALLSVQMRLPANAALPARPTGGWSVLAPALLADAVLGALLYVYGLAHTDLAVGATLSSLAPLVSVPVALALGEERWSASRFAAVLTTVAGVAILVVGGSP
jgi:drug/metabolite transporter (DMT)-like permease